MRKAILVFVASAFVSFTYAQDANFDVYKRIESDKVLNLSADQIAKIKKLNREVGAKFRAIGKSNLPGYEKEILHQFEENGIPLFLDSKKDVSGNPFIRLMKSALEILRRGFDYESMFQYLRTGLVTEEEEKTDRLETYVRAMGIRGLKNWEGQWEKTFEGGIRLNLKELK